MGNALTIENDHVWLPANLPENFRERGCLAKGQEPGHIWEFHGIRGQGLASQYEVRKTKYQDCRIDFLALLLIRNIGPGDRLHRLCERQLANLATETPLNFHGFLTGEVPGMECANFHRVR
jgi:hypothetical protein